VKAADVGPVPAEERTQSALDLFLIFAGANIVATTLLSGASLVPAFGTRQVALIVAVGAVAGAALVAALAGLGPRLGVPSVVAARAALGIRGGGLLALVLYVTNFAWIALNNVVAASACSRVLGGADSRWVWAVGLGLLATAVVARGPRAVGLADRLAVPAMAVTATLLTLRCLALPPERLWTEGRGGMSWPQGLDVVIGYQVSWLLMFADYSRYTASGRKAAAAVFLALAATALWIMPVGAIAARAVGSADPGAMMTGLGVGPAGALLLALATVTTNFVNIYLSALAFKSLVPRAGDTAVVWSIGAVGAALSLLQRAWLEAFGAFMWGLGACLVPVGGVLLAHFFLVRRATDVPALYDPAGRYAYTAGFHVPGLVAWGLGAGAYFVDTGVGGTLQSLLTAIAVYGIAIRIRYEKIWKRGAGKNPGAPQAGGST
jgi:NCS1 family nucleobase:cation symporter-1